ncbi:helix-turn-helix domain-containing protein [Dactylosporangium sp. NPDC051484]|uniref:helix-turn-helix domain-containing protein n=1 Tax=Dactylosporangium sp. NPDC051484 TaxID=3154942 RepID=UPI00344C1CD3
MPVIARLVQADEDSVRQVIHRFNEMGMGSLNPQWAGGRPRLISEDDETFIVATASIRPEAPGQPFTRWSCGNSPTTWPTTAAPAGSQIGRERLRQLLRKHDLPFQRTKTRPSALTAGRAGHRRDIRTGYRRAITSCTGCGSSTAATRSATTSSGASYTAVSPQRTPSPRSSRSASGQPGTRSSC